MTKVQHATVSLPGSKSESNRALMIAVYGGFPLEAENLSEAHDTTLLSSLLQKIQKAESNTTVEVDCEDAGTVSRFLMTYLAQKPGTWVLTGTERLCQRPMAPLISALRQLGADMVCLDVEGQLPVRIKGVCMEGGPVTLDASQSSQFVSSLLLAAPSFKKGLRLSLSSGTVSSPYIRMTLSMMEGFGVHAEWDGNEIAVAPQSYQSCRFEVFADWSAASYWYEMMALSSGGSLLLKGLRPDPMQGDSKVAEAFSPLGIQTDYQEEGALLTKVGEPYVTTYEFDFSDTPDLFPAIFVTCVAKNINSVFYGTSILSLKESDRIHSLVGELSKIYSFECLIKENRIIVCNSSIIGNFYSKNVIFFNAYKDHRIVMSLAGLRVKFAKVRFDSETPVNKSYPNFWYHLKYFLRIFN